MEAPVWSVTVCNKQVAIGDCIRLKQIHSGAYYGQITRFDENARNGQAIVVIRVKSGSICFQEDIIENIEILEKLPKEYQF